uniref:Centromere protein X n=1 Tax=Strigops habroptila TaxID=2489341 RepID=A0A672UEV8_STRHB
GRSRRALPRRRARRRTAAGPTRRTSPATGSVPPGPGGRGPAPRRAPAAAAARAPAAPRTAARRPGGTPPWPRRSPARRRRALPGVGPPAPWSGRRALAGSGRCGARGLAVPGEGEVPEGVGAGRPPPLFPPPSSPALLSAQETVDRLLRLHFRDGRTRVNGDAQLLMAEMLKVFVREAAARAARQAHAEDLEKVDVEHVEKVLPQLLLDF